MYRRMLLSALLGLTLSACVPYYEGGQSYYRSEVYTSPTPTYYYGGGSVYQYRRDYYPAPRYYTPAPRYYSAPRYYQPAPRYYSAPRYYPSGPRAGYRPYPNQGWGDRGGHDRRGDRGDHRGGRGGHW
ncbi:hypothetical protein [Pseudomonas rhodesiae]|uniref:hypothetical protein n=1 Tax=Pseudomonas rhodesiae TaxID=76760 RepID=UPI0032B2B8BB